MPTLSSFVSGFHKCHLFLRETIINAKKAFQRSGFISFTCFYYCTVKKRDIAFKFLCVLFLCSFLTYILIFLITAKYGFLQEFIFGKMGNCDFWGSKKKNQKIRDISICRAFNFTFLVVLDYILL